MHATQICLLQHWQRSTSNFRSCRVQKAGDYLHFWRGLTSISNGNMSICYVQLPPDSYVYQINHHYRKYSNILVHWVLAPTFSLLKKSACVMTIEKRHKNYTCLWAIARSHDHFYIHSDTSLFWPSPALAIYCYLDHWPHCWKKQYALWPLRSSTIITPACEPLQASLVLQDLQDHMTSYTAIYIRSDTSLFLPLSTLATVTGLFGPEKKRKADSAERTRKLSLCIYKVLQVSPDVHIQRSCCSRMISQTSFLGAQLKFDPLFSQWKSLAHLYILNETQGSHISLFLSFRLVLQHRPSIKPTSNYKSNFLLFCFANATGEYTGLKIGV